MENLLLGASAVAMLVGLGGLVCSHRRWPRAPARKPGKRSHVATACLLGPLGLAAATSFAQVGRSDRGCDANSLPGPEEALIYRHSNYRGDYRILSVGNYPNSTSFSLPNDSVSSLKVGENVRIDLFWEAWFYMHYLDWITTLEGPNKGDADYNPHDPIHWRGLPYLSRRRAPARVAATTWNDQTASIRVQRKDHLWMYPGPGQVVLFTEANFNVPCNPVLRQFGVSCDHIMKDVGEYPTTAEVGLQNDSISSIRAGPCTHVEVCSHDDFSEPCVSFDAPWEGRAIEALSSHNMNDRVTSVRIRGPMCW